MPSVKHKKVSAKADSTEDQLIRPSEWNDDHNLNTLAASVWLGQNATGPGPVKELPVESVPGDDFTIMTKDAILAAIDDALGGITSGSTGDIAASVAASKAGGWVLCNGQTLSVANGASNQALFYLLWDIPAWPVSPSRGSTKEADWTAAKTVPVPDMRGSVPGMIDASGTINSLLPTAKLGLRVGVEKVTLTVANLPAHTHTSVTLTGSNSASTGGPVQGGTSGDTGSTGSGTAVSVVQPTVGVNFFIKL